MGVSSLVKSGLKELVSTTRRAIAALVERLVVMLSPLTVIALWHLGAPGGLAMLAVGMAPRHGPALANQP